MNETVESIESFVPTPPVYNEFTQPIPLVIDDSNELQPSLWLELLIEDQDLNPFKESVRVKDHFDDVWTNGEFIIEHNEWLDRTANDLEELRQLIDTTTIYADALVTVQHSIVIGT